MKAELVWSRASDRPISQSPYGHFKMDVISCGHDVLMTCWKHVHRVGESGPGLSDLEWFIHAVTVQRHSC